MGWEPIRWVTVSLQFNKFFLRDFHTSMLPLLHFLLLKKFKLTLSIKNSVIEESST